MLPVDSLGSTNTTKRLRKIDRGMGKRIIQCKKFEKHFSARKKIHLPHSRKWEKKTKDPFRQFSNVPSLYRSICTYLSSLAGVSSFRRAISWLYCFGFWYDLCIIILLTLRSCSVPTVLVRLWAPILRTETIQSHWQW